MFLHRKNSRAKTVAAVVNVFKVYRRHDLFGVPFTVKRDLCKQIFLIVACRSRPLSQFRYINLSFPLVGRQLLQARTILAAFWKGKK
jgi:hypothetical protein